MSTSTPRAKNSWRRRLRRVRKRITRFPGYIALRVVHAVVSRLPLRVGLLLSRVVGTGFYYFSSLDRRAAIENLTAAFGEERSPSEIRRMARRVCQNVTATGIEFAILRRWSTDRLEALCPEVVEGVRRLEQDVHSKGTGAVGVTCHIGNWEMLAIYVQRFAPGLMVSLAMRLYYEPYQRFADRVRTEDGMSFLYTDESPRRFFRAVRDGHLLGTLPDQNVRASSGVFVEFFGRPAWTATFPVDLARRLGTPIVLAFLVRKDPSLRRPGFEFVYEPSVEPPNTDDEADDRERGTLLWTRVVESVIRRHPVQWLWTHRRWRNQPGNPRVARLPKSIRQAERAAAGESED